MDPFSGKSVALTLERPARAFAVLTDEPALALADELGDGLLVVRLRDGALEATEMLAAGDGPRDVAAIDLDGDGLVDLVSADTTGSTLTIQRHAGDAFVPGVVHAAPRPPKHLERGDVDADGAADLLVNAGLGADAGIEIWRNAGGALVEPGMRLALPDAGRVTSGELDGDAGLELAVAIASQDELALLDADAPAALSLTTHLDACSTVRVARIGDLDASGAGDVALACTGEAVVLVDPARGGSERVALSGVGQLYDVAIADFDGDGRLDLAAVDASDHLLRLWLAPFASPPGPASVHAVARGPVALAPVDIDRDGDPDLAVLAYEQRAIQVLLNDGG